MRRSLKDFKMALNGRFKVFFNVKKAYTFLKNR